MNVIDRIDQYACDSWAWTIQSHPNALLFTIRLDQGQLVDASQSFHELFSKIGIPDYRKREALTVAALTGMKMYRHEKEIQRFTCLMNLITDLFENEPESEQRVETRHYYGHEKGCFEVVMVFRRILETPSVRGQIVINKIGRKTFQRMVCQKEQLFFVGF